MLTAYERVFERCLAVDFIDFRRDSANFKQAWSALAAPSVLQVSVLAAMEIALVLTAYRLIWLTSYRKKLTFKYLFVFQLNYPISYLWTRMLL